ncbi:hypothetical protein BASA82_000818 [Batrachochytrium salamandrivorans]|nr:hypothetical protein BASA61_005560 [Batrachochytrium salamandrivorans]KAH9262140.1 hypothetical protein BASA82_000818 [Batrachochytrium salamandrivorans]KAH9267226.1 hypothetical protein BASA84_000768 [Batrachochytrium salamandrivorans]
MPMLAQPLLGTSEPEWMPFNVRPLAVDDAVLGLLAQHTHGPSSPAHAAQAFQIALDTELAKTQGFLSCWREISSSAVARFHLITEQLTTDQSTRFFSELLEISNQVLLKRLLRSTPRFRDNNAALARKLLEGFKLLLPRESQALLPEWSLFEQRFSFLVSNEPFDQLIDEIISLEASVLHNDVGNSGCPVDISIKEAVRADNGTQFAEILSGTEKDALPSISILLAITRHSPRCLVALFSSGIQPSTPMFGDVLNGNLFHYLASASSPKSDMDCLNALFSIESDCADSISTALLSPNELGRLPIHQAAISGNLELTRRLLEFGPVSTMLSGSDLLGHTPIALASLHGHDRIVALFLSYFSELMPKYVRGALRLACHVEEVLCVKELLGGLKTLDFQDDLGETIACFSANLGNTRIITLLLESSIDWNICNLAGQSPLVCASIAGHIEIVRLLLQSPKVDVHLQDRSGLCAHELAVLHGNMDIAELLSHHKPEYSSEPVVPLPDKDRTVDIPFGEDVLRGESWVQVCFGTMDFRDKHTFLQLADAQDVLGDGVHVLKVYAQTSQEICLATATIPLQTSCVYPFPFEFRAVDLYDVVIYFEIWNSCDLKTGAIGMLPKAVAHIALMSPKSPMWLEKTESCGKLVIPLAAHPSSGTAGGRTIGTLQIEIVVANSLKGIEMSSRNVDTGCDLVSKGRWVSHGTKIVGHRGLGKNLAPVNGQSYLQLGENTIPSLIKGGEFGAEYVEFDVQLTKDCVPVIYHNFITTEYGFDAPLNELPLSKFLTMQPKMRSPLKRSQSLSGRHMPTYMPLTPPLGKMAPNSYGSIQSGFPTLETAFVKVPMSTGFNIEVKYPTLQEAEMFGLCNPDINLFCDCILDVVFSHAKTLRNIYFSSFHPEICLLLCRKQNKYPVFFLTVGGMEKTYDKRLNSLWNAMMVAKQVGCVGVVTVVNPLLQAPRIISTLRRSGLALFTYGSPSNAVPCCKIQRAYGVDGIITDKVHHIAVGLKDD